MHVRSDLSKPRNIQRGVDAALHSSKKMGRSSAPQYRSPRSRILPALVGAAMLVLAMTTGIQAVFDSGDDRIMQVFGFIRFLVLPTVLFCWFLSCRGDRRPVVWRLQLVSILPLLMVGWLALGSVFSIDPLGSVPRAVALLVMIWGSLAVLGRARIVEYGGRGLFVATFCSCLLIALMAAAASIFGGSRGWDMFGERYYGPLGATTLGPICMAGLLSGCVLFRLERRRRTRLRVS